MMYQRALHVTPKVTLQVAVHADDNKFFECAYEADIPIIISLDAHVNGTEPVETCNGRIIQVLSPWQFIQQHRITG